MRAPRPAARQGEPYEGPSTTHLVTADKWGNVASYTLTIEQTGGSGITVPGYGFLLNNELTDFNFTPLSILPVGTDPNLPGPGKRPRSSMSPTIVVKDGKPYLTVGSPGGATIITSVSQTILGYLDRDLSLVDAIAAPRLSSRNGAEGAEPRSSTARTATRSGAHGPQPRVRRYAQRDRGGHRDPSARWQRVRGGRGDCAARRRLGDGGATVAVTRQPG